MKYLALGLLLGTLAPAFAADCGPLQIVATLPLQPHNDGRVEVVPVKVNGVEKHFLFDTGGAMSQITAKAAEELKLPIGGTLYTLQDAGANKSSGVASVDHLQIGNAQLKDTTLNIMPGGDFWADNGIDGILAIDLFLRYDMDLDFGHDKVNFISPNHCDGRVVYWPADVQAETTMRIVDAHYLIDVTLDGRHLKALVDTGASRTIMGLSAANQFYGLTPTAGLTETDIKTNGDLKTYTHKFEDLSFNGVDIQTPPLDVINFPNDISNRRQASLGSRLARREDIDDHYDMILGMDLMRHLHVYIATNERKIYITPK